jgi:hypothetical protein
VGDGFQTLDDFVEATLHGGKDADEDNEDRNEKGRFKHWSPNGRSWIVGRLDRRIATTNIVFQVIFSQ